MARLKLEVKIMETLKSSTKPMSKGEVNQALRAPKPAERTLSRALADMASDGRLVKHGEKAKSKYSLPLSASEAFLVPAPISPKDIPDQISFQGYLPFLNRYFEARSDGHIFYDKQRLEAYDPNKTQLLPHLIVKSLPLSRKKHLMDGNTYADEVVLTFLKQFTFNSSRLEGAVESLAATEKIMNENNPRDENTLVVINHRRAADWLVKCAMNPEFELSNAMANSAKPIKELHMVLMDGLIENDNEGIVRDDIVRISGSSYIPLSSVEELEINLNLIAITGSKIENPYEKSFFFLTQISYLQAFWDGNKRTGRLISNLPLFTAGLAPNSFHKLDENNYLESILYYYETGDARPLAMLWAESYTQGMSLFSDMENMYQYTNELKILMNEDRIKVVQKAIARELGREGVSLEVTSTWTASSNKSQYGLESLLAQVMTDLDKLAKTGLGSGKYNLDPKAVEQWAANWA